MALLPYLHDIKYEARGISDHSPIVLNFSFRTSPGCTLWKINPYCLSLFPSSEGIVTGLITYQNINRTSVTLSLHPNMLEVNLQGLFIAVIKN